MLKQKLSQWLSKRFQLHRSKQLEQHDILIFIYQQGYVYLVLILITFIAGINYANNLILGFCFLISAILLISFYLTFKQLHQIDVEITLPQVGRVDEPLSIKLQLKQMATSPKYLYLKVEEKIYPILFQDAQRETELSFVPQTRGKFIIPPIQLYSTYPLGLVRAWTYFYISAQIWIAPAPQYFHNEHQASSSTGQPDLDEFRELRNYQIGDSLQAVSWKQVARGQGLYVKQFEDHSDVKVMEIDYEQMPSSSHEEKLRLIMGLVDLCEQQNAPYKIQLKHISLDQGQGYKQYQAARMILAQA